MHIRSYTVIKHELKQLRAFYSTTQTAYSKAKSVMDTAATSSDFRENLRREGIGWSKGEAKLLVDARRLAVENMLRELVFVRAISALETFLVDAIRDVFVVTKIPFMIKESRIEFSQEELIANNSPMKIFTKIINRETRRLTSGGFNEFIKYYKRRFNIDLAAIPPGYQRMNEYHDSRHILVHRLGHTDEEYRNKYHTDCKKISVHSDFLSALLDDIERFSGKVDQEVGQLIRSAAAPDSIYNARYVVEVLMLSKEVPACLQPGFQYWADDEYIVMTDILLGTSPAADGRVRYYFTGSNGALRHLQRYLRRERKKLRIYLKEVSDVVRSEKRMLQVQEGVVEAVREALPAQPWEKGVHKAIAKKLRLSNGLVSRAIDVLISRGVFKNQLDGKIVD